ncbi:hypothetical protein CAOG_010065 [Capsaspora owczarzaki ATCC 30864]|uniref:Secreted protein n=1 Tax=Capsaspora owczarzaki (strain ATCC 30864) TaxID=595528 RepID=A0A0D2WWL1_CAPO3|nr:hypothetical protein CAOG_010065 [Capsaspora owczarzaki ATCC 30864]
MGFILCIGHPLLVIHCRSSLSCPSCQCVHTINNHVNVLSKRVSLLNLSGSGQGQITNFYPWLFPIFQPKARPVTIKLTRLTTPRVTRCISPEPSDVPMYPTTNGRTCGQTAMGSAVHHHLPFSPLSRPLSSPTRSCCCDEISLPTHLHLHLQARCVRVLLEQGSAYGAQTSKRHPFFFPLCLHLPSPSPTCSCYCTESDGCLVHTTLQARMRARSCGTSPVYIRRPNQKPASSFLRRA